MAYRCDECGERMEGKPEIRVQQMRRDTQYESGEQYQPLAEVCSGCSTTYLGKLP